MAVIGLLFFQGADGIHVRSYPALEYMRRVHNDDLEVQLQVNALWLPLASVLTSCLCVGTACLVLDYAQTLHP